MSWNKLFINEIKLPGIHGDLWKKQGDGLSEHIKDYFSNLSNESTWLGSKEVCTLFYTITIFDFCLEWPFLPRVANAISIVLSHLILSNH